MLPNAGCLSEWHDGGREEKVSHAVRAYQIFRSQLARSSCGTPYSALARIYERTYEKHRQEQCVHAQSYASMLHNLMDTIQNYLLLNDNDKERGALQSLELVDSIAQVREDNRICICLEDVQTQR